MDQGSKTMKLSPVLNRRHPPHRLRLYILSAFLPKASVALVLFSIIIALVDVFANLWRFLAMDAKISQIIMYLLLGLPAALVNALPVSFMFAGAYALSELQATGEFAAMLATGERKTSLSVPLILLALAASFSTQYFDDAVSVTAIRSRNALQRSMLKQQETFSSSDISVISKGGGLIYNVGYYDDASTILQNLVLVVRDDTGAPLSVIEAGSAQWVIDHWVLKQVRKFEKLDVAQWRMIASESLDDPHFDETPETFRSRNRDIKEMRAEELDRYAQILVKAGLPSGHVQAERERRKAFSFATLAVTIMAVGTAGIFKKNILLASLILSLVSATVYYVIQMISMLLARIGDLPPLIGAWFPLVLFSLISLGVFLKTDT